MAQVVACEAHRRAESGAAATWRVGHGILSLQALLWSERCFLPPL
jgi:hypothetical protein